MALRHVVMWKLSGEDRATRDTQADEIIAALQPLPATVPSIRGLSVHRNELFDGDNWDVTLIVDVDDEAGLEAYATHPDHVAAGAVVKQYAVGRVATDFTV